MNTALEREFYIGYSKGFEDGIIYMNKYIKKLIKKMKKEGIE